MGVSLRISFWTTQLLHHQQNLPVPQAFRLRWPGDAGGAVVKGFLIPSWNRTSFFLFLGRLGHAGSCGTNLEDVSMGVPGGLTLTPFAFSYPFPTGSSPSGFNLPLVPPF